MRGRILIVDNDPDRLDSTRVLLEARGYAVSTADTIPKAETLLGREGTHVALLDVRMEADSDAADTSGLAFAARIDPVVAKIIVTGYPSYEAAKEALGTSEEMRAVDFITKQDGPAALLAAVERAFREKVQINFDLAIGWEKGLSPEQAAGEIEMSAAPVSVPVDEMEEILAKLFHAADELRVARLIPNDRLRLSSQSGSAILRAQAHYPEGGWAAPVVAKLAERRKARQEAENYRRHVRDFVGGHRRTSLDGFAETRRLGGILYSLVGASLDETLDLGTFYARRPADEIVPTLEQLFEHTCRLWYDNRKPRAPVELGGWYRETLHLTWEKIEASLREAELADLLTPASLRCPGVDDIPVNPVAWARGCPAWERPVHLCATHGDLHSRNVLVDDGGQAWLIDFYRTGEGHLLRDVLELETDVKFHLLDATEPAALLAFETALLGQRRLDEPPPADFGGEPALEKAFAVVVALRGIAGRLLGAEAGEGDMEEYYQGLFWLTLNTLRLRNMDPLKKRHALLAGAVLAGKLAGG
jgi:CheY-like chemotaxis protein